MGFLGSYSRTRLCQPKRRAQADTSAKSQVLLVSVLAVCGIKHLDVDDADKKVHDGPLNFSLSEEIMPRNGAFEEDVRLNLSLYHIGADYLLTYFKRNSEGVER